MAKQGITTGSAPNDGTGDTLLAGAVKINSNFNELYTYLGNGSNLNYIGGRWSNTNVGISTLSNVGIGTTNPTSALTVTGDTKIVGVLTANTFIGNLTGNVTGNVVGGVTGNVTGTASTAQGLTGTPSISVADITASGKVSAGGSVTGATIHGNGAALSNIVTSVTAGAGVTVSASTGGITISSASGGAQGYFQKNATGINTSSNVGIGNTNATSALTVTGSGKFTGIVTASQFVGALVGNSATANALNSARTIGGVSFDGTSNINLPGVNAAGNQNTTGTAGGLSGTPSISVSVVSASSTITAAKFVGDGAGLTGVTASGTGIVIKDGGSLVGTAGTIDFATNLSVSAISGAAVTVTGATDNNPNVATLVVSGISTLTELEVNSRYGVTSGFGTFVAAAGVAYTINQFTIASNNFKSAEYTVHIERENTQQVQKVLVMQNGSAAYSSEYGIIYNPSLIASIGASVAGGVMKLEVTPETGQTGLTTYRFTRETMK